MQRVFLAPMIIAPKNNAVWLHLLMLYQMFKPTLYIKPICFIMGVGPP